MKFGIFLVIIIAAVFSGIIAFEFSQIADEKGYESKKYFLYTFFFGIMGALMVIALPDRSVKTNGMYTNKDNSCNINKSDAIENNMDKQSDLNTELSQVGSTTFRKTGQNRIICSSCGFEQQAGRAICWKCGCEFEKGD